MIAVLSSWRRSYALIVFATLAIVTLADFLLYGHTLGWTTSVIALAMLAALTMRSAAFLRSTGGRVIAVAALGLLVALVEQPTWLNISYAVLSLFVLAMTSTMGWERDFWPWVQRLARWLLTGWAHVFLDNGLVMRWLVRRGMSPRTARGCAAWIVPVLLASVFVALFAWANPVIAGWISQLGDWAWWLLENLPNLIQPARVVFWLGFGTVAWMLLRSRVRKPRSSEVDFGVPPDEASHYGSIGIPAGFVVRCLILFNLVFAVENGVDVRYLGDQNQLPKGMSYTEYVHRGAYPLVAAALLAGMFVLITFRPRSAAESSGTARKLVYLWIAQTIFLTLTAAWRLEKYVAMSELTRLRVASIIWFLLVGLGLFYIIWRIVRGRSNAWLININAITALVVLYPCCFVNFDGMIADFNARHCEEATGGGSPLDIEYFRELGTPALAALDSVKDRVMIPSRRAQANRLSNDLHGDLATNLNDWRSWTWRRQRSASAAAALANGTTIVPRHLPSVASATITR